MSKEATLIQDLEGKLQSAIERGADRLMVLRLKNGGGVIGALRDIDPALLRDVKGVYVAEKGRAEAEILAKKAHKVAAEIGLRQVFEFAWAKNGEIIEREPFAVEVEETTSISTQDPPTEEGVIRLLMTTLQHERKHTEKILRIHGVVLDHSYEVLAKANAVLEGRNDLLETQSLGVMKAALEQRESAHRLEIAKLEKTSALARTDNMIKQAGEMLKEIAPKVVPGLVAKMMNQGGEGGGGIIDTGMPPSWAQQALGEISKMFETQQSMINGVLTTLKQHGLLDDNGTPKPPTLVVVPTPPIVEPPAAAPTPIRPDVDLKEQERREALEQQEAQLEALKRELQEARTRAEIAERKYNDLEAEASVVDDARFDLDKPDTPKKRGRKQAAATD